MIKEKLICNDNNKCYFVAFNYLTELSNLAGVDIIPKKDEFNNLTNFVVERKTNIELYQSDNPLKLVDFLKGRISGLN